MTSQPTPATEPKKLSIKETKELIEFATLIMSEMISKNKDGKIDMGEWIAITMKTAPAAVKAFVGLDRVDDELKDLDEDEIRDLALCGVALAQTTLSLFKSDGDA